MTLGCRVAVVERGPLRGREQEWNISRKELMELVGITCTFTGVVLHLLCTGQFTKCRVVLWRLDTVAVFRLAYSCVLTREAVVMQGRGGTCVWTGSRGVHQRGVQPSDALAILHTHSCLEVHPYEGTLAALHICVTASQESHWWGLIAQVRAGFHGGEDVWTQDVLNLGVRPDKLIAKVRVLML